jgi:hypothetical protein
MNLDKSNQRAGDLTAMMPGSSGGRDSFWEARHFAEPRPRVAQRKWQCLACGECGFVETTYSEETIAVARRIGHRCQPESIALYSPGAHRPLRD